MLKKGCSCAIGDGFLAKIHHPWVYGATPKWRYQGSSDNSSVAKLRKDDGNWDLDACNNWFSDVSVKKICIIKPMIEGYEDLITWKCDKSGKYSVRSGYRFLLQKNIKMTGTQIVM